MFIWLVKLKLFDDLDVGDVKKNKNYLQKVKSYNIFLIHYRPLVILFSSTTEYNSLFNSSVIYCSCLVIN